MHRALKDFGQAHPTSPSQTLGSLAHRAIPGDRPAHCGWPLRLHPMPRPDLGLTAQDQMSQVSHTHRFTYTGSNTGSASPFTIYGEPLLNTSGTLLEPPQNLPPQLLGMICVDVKWCMHQRRRHSKMRAVLRQLLWRLRGCKRGAYDIVLVCFLSNTWWHCVHRIIQNNCWNNCKVIPYFGADGMKNCSSAWE